MKNDLQYQYLYNYVRTSEPGEIALPETEEWKLMACDLHTHTSLSDGRVTPLERVTEAWREGLHAIALTDHSPFMFGETQSYDEIYNKVRQWGKEKGLIVIKGIELTADKPIGHWNLLFLDNTDDYLYANYPASPETVYALIKKAYRSGSIVMYNHPGWPDRESNLNKFQYDLFEKGYVNAIEVISGPEWYPQTIDNALHYKLSMISSSDLHYPVSVRYDLQNSHRNMTLAFVKDRTEKELIDAIRCGQTIAWADNLLIGSARLLMKLMKAALKIQNITGSTTDFIAEIENTSDFLFIWEGEHRQIIEIHPRKKTTVYISSKDTTELFRVANTMISSTENLSFRLADIFEHIEVLNTCVTRPIFSNDIFYCFYNGPLRALNDLVVQNPQPDDEGCMEHLSLHPFADYDVFSVRFDFIIDDVESFQYYFELDTNGVSKLYIDGQLVWDNDSMCRLIHLEHTVSLTAGKHLVTLFHYQDFTGEYFSFSYHKIVL